MDHPRLGPVEAVDDTLQLYFLCLADRYAGWADRIAVTAPRTALILRSLADGYRADGRREDEEAQRRREGFDN